MNPDWQPRARELHVQHQCGRIKLGKKLRKEGHKVSDRTLGRWMQREGLRGDINQTGTADEIQTEYGQKVGNVTTRSGNIKTLDDALKAADVDLTAWDVDRYVVNSWGGEQVSYQVKVWLRRKVPDPQGEALEKIIARLSSPLIIPPKPRRNALCDPHLLEISLYDHHFGKLAWSRETGQDYDLKIAEHLFSAAVDNLLQKVSGYSIDKILLPLGQDFLHVNNPQGTTAHGTRQDTDSRLAKIFEVGMMAFIAAIEKARKVAPVEVIWVPGNHDTETSYYLAQVVKAYYRNCDDVTVDASPMTRKFKQYGTNLIGYTHGDKEKISNLPLIMAGSVPQLWANTTCRQWHIAHLHSKKETEFVACDSFGPVIVRRLPSLCGTDAWHFEQGYVNGQRAAEGHIWHHAYGYCGHFSANVRELGQM